MRRAIALASLVLLAGCATPRERIVLLPSAGNHSGGLVVRTESGETELSAAYDVAEIRDGAMVAKATTPTDVDKRYGPVMEAQPPRPHAYLVYFRPHSRDLTPESKAQLKAAKEEFDRRDAGEVMVIGHTDRVGSRRVNDRLSLRRARCVRDALTRSGVPASRITVAARGEREPLVPTADGVAELKNRRVEIKIR